MNNKPTKQGKTYGEIAKDIYYESDPTVTSYDEMVQKVADKLCMSWVNAYYLVSKIQRISV